MSTPEPPPEPEPPVPDGTAIDAWADEVLTGASLWPPQPREEQP